MDNAYRWNYLGTYHPEFYSRSVYYITPRQHILHYFVLDSEICVFLLRIARCIAVQLAHAEATFHARGTVPGGMYSDRGTIRVANGPS